MLKPVTFYSEGVQLAGDLFLPADIKPGERRAGIVLCHGYTGVRSIYLADNARVLAEAGYVVLTFDYKGWGDSDGTKTRLAPYSRVADVQAALTFTGAQPDRRLTVELCETHDMRATGDRGHRCGIAERAAEWGRPEHPLLAFAEDCHRGFSRRLVAVGRRAILVMPVGQRAQPRCSLQCGGGLHDAADDDRHSPDVRLTDARWRIRAIEAS